MKKTQRKDAIRNIWKKKVSWISIVIVTMLTVGVFMGCRFYCTGTAQGGEAYYKKYNFKDIDMISTTGILNSEIEQVRNLEGVADVEGYHVLDVTAIFDGENVLIPLIRRTERISTPELLEGKLPEKAGELAVSKLVSEKRNVKIGDKVSLSAEGEQDKLLAAHDYVVTAIVNHPEYMQTIKSEFILAADPSFDTKELNGGYLRALIRVDYPEDTDIFSKKYFDLIHPVEERIEALFPDMIITHKKELWVVAEQRIQDETAGPRQQLADAEKKLEEGKKQLDEGEKKLETSKKEIDENEEKLKAAFQKLENGRKKLEDGLKQYTSGQKSLEDGKAEFQQKVQEAKKKISDARSKLDSAEGEADSGLAKIKEVEEYVSSIGVASGVEFSSAYNQVKELAKEYYLPAAEAMVNQQDSEELLKEAKRKTSEAIQNAMKGDESLADMYDDTTVGKILEGAAAQYGSMKAGEFLDKLSKLAKNGGYDLGQLKLFAGDMTLSDFLDSVKKNDELKDILNTPMSEVIDSVNTKFDELINGYGKAAAVKEAIAGARKKLEEEASKAQEKLDAAEEKLKEAEKKLLAAKKELDAGQEEYDKGVEEYDKGKEQLDDGKKKYEEGVAEFDEKKQEYEKGEKEYGEGKAKLDAEVEEARRKVELKLDGYFAIQNRRANNGFVNIRTNVNTIAMASWAFIILFLVVSAMVTFSTIVIIVDEQRNLAGAMKSLGFFNSAIKAKYTVFGLSAAITGILLGVLAGIGVESVFRYGVALMYVFGRPSFVFTAFPLVIASVLVIIVVFIAIHISTRGMLKLSAIQLMSGFKNTKSLKGKDKGKTGGIYGKLILRNMRIEKSRVIITTLIIAVSCGLIGVGFNLKKAFSGMIDQEAERVWGYDVKVTYGAKATDASVEKMEQAMKELGVSYRSIAEIGTIYRDNDLQEYTYIQVMDQDIVGDFYHVLDWDTGEEMTIPDDGVLIQNRLYETRGLKEGDTYKLYDHKLKEHTVTVKGVYTNHVGRAVIMSREGYYKLFGLEATDNVFFVRLNGASPEDLKSRLDGILPGLAYDTAEKLKDDYKEIINSYNTVVYLLTGMAIFMSIFVLANLTNIFISRRWKELTIMRVNGFSVRQCIGYLIRETLTTAILGFIIAVLLGAFISRLVVGMIEQPDTMLDRAFQPDSWVIAVLLEAVFASVIDFLVFRKVKKLKVTDVNN